MGESKFNMPMGMKPIFLVYILCIVAYILSTLIAMSKSFPGVAITLNHMIMGIVSFATWILIIISIYKRYRWGWYLILIYTIYGLTYPIAYHFLRPSELPYYPILTFIAIVISLAIGIYIVPRRSYFSI